ncbi:MAG: hypothetical protein Q8N73_00265 [bacterium]|nr:hypothetical protein [bacterium]
MKKTITILILFELLLPSFYFVQAANQSSLSQPPETLKEAEIVGGKILKLLPETLKGIWQEALGIWQTMGKRAKNFSDSYIRPWFQNIWQKIQSSFGKEIEQRKPIIEEEFKKEKEEMKTDLPKVGKPLWERFKELIK